MSVVLQGTGCRGMGTSNFSKMWSSLVSHSFALFAQESSGLGISTTLGVLHSCAHLTLYDTPVLVLRGLHATLTLNRHAASGTGHTRPRVS